MNLRNTFLPAQVNQILRLTQNAFLILGVLALSYAGYVLVDAWLYQAAQVRQFLVVRDAGDGGQHVVECVAAAYGHVGFA